MKTIDTLAIEWRHNDSEEWTTQCVFNGAGSKEEDLVRQVLKIELEAGTLDVLQYRVMRRTYMLQSETEVLFNLA